MTDLVKTIYSDDDNQDQQEDSEFEVAFDQDFTQIDKAPLEKSKNKVRDLVRDDQKKTTSLNQKVEKLLKKKERLSGANTSKSVENTKDSKNKPIKKGQKEPELEVEADENAKKTSDRQGSKTWDEIGLIKPLLRAVSELNYTHPTLIQEMTIPVINSNRDVLASSITGSGKTASFLLPLIQKFYKMKYNLALGNYTKALVICPTRELAVQCYEVFSKLNKFTNLTHCLVIGKVPLQRQEAEVRRCPDLIIATPGRIVDLLKNSQTFNLDGLEMLIFDEADKLLSMGFKAEIEEIVENLPKNRQTLLFSATLDDEVKTLVKLALQKPLRVQANPDNRVSSKLSQQVVLVDEYSKREAALVHLLTQELKSRCIVFFKTKRNCHRLAIILGLLGLKVCELHGNMTQQERVQAFEDFREEKTEIMLATDLAARGLDIKNLNFVVNFELPRELTRYIHRIGRTARAGEMGTCITLVDKEELKSLKKMVRQTKDKLSAKKIGPADIASARLSIDNIASEVAEIFDEEKVERELRLAEMEAAKAENLVRYKHDIYTKPKREWMVSEKRKREIQEEDKKERFGDEENQPKSFKKSSKNGQLGKRPPVKRDFKKGKSPGGFKKKPRN